MSKHNIFVMDNAGRVVEISYITLNWRQYWWNASSVFIEVLERGFVFKNKNSGGNWLNKEIRKAVSSDSGTTFEIF